VTRASCLGFRLCRKARSGFRSREGRCKATWKREFKLPWREAGPPNHHDDKVDSDQQVVNKELSRRQGVVASRGAGSAMIVFEGYEPSTLNQ
jgi:hypothetical protein